MIFAGIVAGFIPIIQGWILVVGGIILFRSTQAPDWRLPSWIDRKLPKKVKDLIYKDITLLKRERDKKKRS